MTPPVMAAPPANPAPATGLRPHGQGRPCVITRRATFSASHRYWLPELSAEENQARFGACTIAPGHGHNYELIVAMGGGLDADGMVLNLSDVKHAIRDQVTGQLDFRCLNEVWPEFDLSRPEGTLPTTEALVHAIWTRLAPHLPLMGLRLYETDKLWADVVGDSMEAFLTIRTHFAAAHRLARPELSQEENDSIYGKCARPHGHGHNYLLDVTVRGSIDPRTGMVCDLAALQHLVDDLLDLARRDATGPPQTHREPIDLDQSDETVMAAAEALARSRPKFRSRAEWLKEMQQLMGYQA